MLDHDLTATEARHLLSVRDDDPAGWSRRRFLGLVAAGLVGGAVTGDLSGLFPGAAREALATPPVSPTDGILVLVTMYGGNDGFNMVVPYTDGRYYSARGSLAIPPGQVRLIDDRYGFHPNLAFLHQLYHQGKVAVVNGVGYPRPDLSHFTSMASWMSARPGGTPSSGWVGRWLDALGGAVDDFRGASVDSSVPLHMQGEERRAAGIAESGGGWGTATSARDQRMYAAMRRFAASPAGRGPWHDAIATTIKAQLDLAGSIAPVYATTLPDGEIVRKMEIAARLINADLGFRVIDVSWGDFDTHAGQPYQHGERMRELDAALAQLFASLQDRFRGQVTVLTVSEFGRTPYANGSAGTDHGTASSVLVIGDHVRGGLYGQYPTFAGLARWDRPAFHVDFRSVYASVIDGWLGGGSTEVLRATFEDLHLFSATPGSSGGTPPPPGGGVDPPPEPGTPPALVPADYVALTPFRVFDSRGGAGGRSVPLAPGESVDVQVGGLGGVPASGAFAVALNVTGTGASQPTYLTVWSPHRARPWTSNVNLVPGRTTPNLVVAELSSGGRVRLYNAAGSTHVVIDVVGYFRSGGGTRLLPLVPARVLDTREGLGAPARRLGPGGQIDVTLEGVGGVPAGSTAVVLNVTATRVSAASFVTVWPTGTSMPLASSLNVQPGDTVPNLVVAPIGTGGRVSFYNALGEVDLVADVVGCFCPSATGRHVPIAPARLMDTRDGTGGTSDRIGQQPVALGVVGVGGVPASGVSAVLLNVTAVAPTAATYLTVWPAGESMPLASSLNASAGQTVANSVMAKVGANGRVMIFNAAGATDVVVDVAGYFTT